MSTDLIRVQPGANVPMVANANEQNDMFSSGANSSPKLPKLSIRGGSFRFNKGGVEQNLNLRVLQIVLVSGRKPKQRAFFSKKFDPANPIVAPDCASDNNVMPNIGVAHPQSPTCAACPQNVWGSKISEASGKAIRACGESKFLVVSPLSDSINEAASLQIPATSFKGFDKYIAQLNAAGLVANRVITQIEFADTSFPMIDFTCVGYLNESQAAQVNALANSEEVLEAVTVSEPRALPTLPPMPPAQPAPVFAAPHASQTPIVQPAPAQPIATQPASAPVTTAFGGSSFQAATPQAVNSPPVSQAVEPEVMPPVNNGDAGSEDKLTSILANWSK